MQFQIPPAAASEIAAAYLQAAITVGLALLFSFLNRRYRKPYFGWFALAWFLYALRTGAIIRFLVTEHRIWLYWHQVVTGLTGLALLWAALVFSEQLRWKRPYLVFVLFPPLWSYVAIYQMDNFLLAAGPAVAFLSAATVWTGWTFVRHLRRVGSTAAGFLAGSFFLWGLHHLDYPFLRARGAWNPWGYYLDTLFVLGVGAGILLLVIEDLQRGLGAMSSLSGELQRRGPEEEVLDALLEGTLALASVRGSAMYLSDEGGERFVRGAGECAGWVGREATGPAAAAIARVVRTGRPEAITGGPAAPFEGATHPFAAALPILQERGVAGVLVMVGDARDPFAALDDRFLVALGQQVGAALENADLYRRLQERSAALERLAARMAQQHESERRRLSRELHDETAQVFSAVRLQIGLLRETAAPDVAPRLDRVLELIDTGMRSIRSVTSDLRPSLLDELGLVPALRALAQHFGDRSGLAVRLDAPDDVPSLPDSTELALYRALQEALANIARHADASVVEVRIGVTPETVELVVRDDGRGFPPEWSLAEFERAGHNGLAGMRERLTALGGGLAITPRPDRGAELVVRVPRALRSTVTARDA